MRVAHVRDSRSRPSRYTLNPPMRGNRKDCTRFCMKRCQLAMTWNVRDTSRASSPKTMGSQGRQWLEASNTPEPASSEAVRRSAPTHAHEVMPKLLRRYVGKYHWMIRAQNGLKRGGTKR